MSDNKKRLINYNTIIIGFLLLCATVVLLCKLFDVQIDSWFGAEGVSDLLGTVYLFGFCCIPFLLLYRILLERVSKNGG